MSLAHARLLMLVPAALLIALVGCSSDDAATAADTAASVTDVSSASDVTDPTLVPDTTAPTPDVGPPDVGAPDIPPVDVPPPVPAERFEACDAFGGQPQCAPPLICVGTCQLPCTAGCPQGEECIELVAGNGTCGTRVAKDGACDLVMALVCEEQLVCVEGVCIEPNKVGLDGDCGPQDVVCEDGLSCFATGIGEGLCRPECAACSDTQICVEIAVIGSGCFEDCDLAGGETDCAEGFVCQEPIGGGDDACLPGRAPGETGYAEACSDELPACQEGLTCPPLPGAYCTATCEGDADCPTEPAGATCQQIPVLGGWCTFNCPNGVSDCPMPGMQCQDVFGTPLCSYPEPGPGF